GFTRNPLAEPGILGVNAGAALAVVTAVALLGVGSSSVFAVFAFAGAALAAATIVGVASLGRGALPATTLVLAGTALMALFTSLTTAILIQEQGTLADVRFWLAGSVAGRDLSVLRGVAPYMLAGMAIGLLLSRSLTTLGLGEDVARAVGQRIAWVKGAGLVAVILLAGASVAVAGPIAFVGLIVPNGVRLLVGFDYRRIIPLSAVLGAALVLAADVISRMVLRPAEVPVGVTIALIGGPALIYIVHRGGRWAS
ncbi:MAG: FecCD family ABC transporter permease, partial [Myxococcota bacterium]